MVHIMMSFMNHPRVAQCALEKSGASFKKGRVEAINLKPNGGFVLRSDCLIKCHFSQRQLLNKGDIEVGVKVCLGLLQDFSLYMEGSSRL